MQLSDRIGRRMKLRDLHVLMTVVQAGSMNKSAALLNTTQPAISKSIADLEHAFGVRLLDRHPQGVEPTEYGRVLLNCGAAVFDELRQSVRNIESLADPTAGEIWIGCPASLATGFVSFVVERLSKRYPRMVFHLISRDPEELHRDLQERRVDLLIARLSKPVADEQLQFEHLFEGSYGVAAGTHNPWARRRKITLAELAGEPWVMPPPEAVAYSVALDLFRSSGLDFPRATAFAIPEVRMKLLATGRFISIFSETRIFGRHPEIKVLPIALPTPPVPVGVVTLKGRTLSPSAQLFIKTAQEAAKPLAK